MSGQFKRFKKARYCPNASAIGYSKHSVNEGDLISFCADGDHQRLGRVLGLATHGGDGKKYKKPRLAVLAASDMLSFGMERHVDLDDVLEIFDPSRIRDFARFFLFGDMSSPEETYKATAYGAMSDSYIGKYLTYPEGQLRKDWHDVAMKKAPPTKNQACLFMTTTDPEEK